MNRCDNTCDGCLWADSCDSKLRCEDYTPVGSEHDVLFYEAILQENAEEYQSLVNEMNS